MYVFYPGEDLSRVSNYRGQDLLICLTNAYLTQLTAFFSVKRLSLIRWNSSPPVASSKVKYHLELVCRAYSEKGQKTRTYRETQSDPAVERRWDGVTRLERGLHSAHPATVAVLS